MMAMQSNEAGAFGVSACAPRGADARTEVPVVLLFVAILTVLGAGFAVALGPLGIAQGGDDPSPLREAELRVAGGDVTKGQAAMASLGCQGCHVVPGMAGPPQSKPGPSLVGFSDRMTIAGKLINRPSNLMIWLQDPARFAPRSAMPDLGIDQQTSADIAAYLYRR